ncbi:peroxiredoxin [Azonexus sp.]|uniref:peroxiredoxin n=1 Tax=Azonexus sp. TaxID=1872668 RepID=UPI0039E316FC
MPDTPNTPVTNFTLPTTSGLSFDLAAQRGKTVVIYFYPKDSTPGCTTEGRDFSALFSAFSAANTVILGVSRDSLRAHENFKCKQEFPFELGSDADETLCQQFGVIKEKMMYGKLCRGIERSTFVIDKNGVLRREWRAVKVAGHAQEVLDFVLSL